MRTELMDALYQARVRALEASEYVRQGSMSASARLRSTDHDAAHSLFERLVDLTRPRIPRRWSCGTRSDNFSPSVPRRQGGIRSAQWSEGLHGRQVLGGARRKRGG